MVIVNLESYDVDGRRVWVVHELIGALRKAGVYPGGGDQL